MSVYNDTGLLVGVTSGYTCIKRTILNKFKENYSMLSDFKSGKKCSVLSLCCSKN